MEYQCYWSADAGITGEIFSSLRVNWIPEFTEFQPDRTASSGKRVHKLCLLAPAGMIDSGPLPFLRCCCGCGCCRCLLRSALGQSGPATCSDELVLCPADERAGLARGRRAVSAGKSW